MCVCVCFSWGNEREKVTFIAEINFIAILTSPLLPYSLLSDRKKKVRRDASLNTTTSPSG